MAVDSEYRGKPLRNVVATSIEGNVIGVEVKSQPVILPDVGGSPQIPQCSDRHIIRTENFVAVVDVTAKVQIFPRVVSFNDVWDEACESVEAALDEDGVEVPIEKYAEGVSALADRIACRLRSQGITVS